MDNALLGWLFPKGQLALYLDTQSDFGVTTGIGRVYAEILQILYISYYFWGNAIGVWLAYQYFYYCVYKKNKGTKKRSAERQMKPNGDRGAKFNDRSRQQLLVEH